jgi:hypothetical protein|tara:strand:+ start:2102 stop:3247 length:1146 start_codon:yes stop_codon:yes gene_type:complete
MKKTITLVRLRSSERYKEPLTTIVDSMFHVYEKFTLYNFDYNFKSYNCCIGCKKVPRNTQDLKDSDVIIIPTEAEFTYHIRGRQSNISFGRSWTFVQNMREILNDGKHRDVVLITSDRADSIELFRDRVFPDSNMTFHIIDENEFDGNLHHLKYHFIKDLNIKETEKKYDFIYWGTSKKFKVDFTSEQISQVVKDWYDKETGELTHKSNKEKNELKVRFEQPVFKGVLSEDERHIILKDIKREDKIKSHMVGAFDGFKYDQKFSKKFARDVVPELMKGRSTLCFNWVGYDEALTSRYNESMSCGIVPLVWKNYDINNILVESDWQRCWSIEDVKEKINQLKDNNFYQETFDRIHKKYLSVCKPKKYYEELFEKKLNRIIED